MASSLEVNKVLAAILTAGVIASGSGVLSRILYHAEVPEEPVYAVALTEGEDGEPAAEAEAPIGALLANASVEDGQTEAKKCAACHTFEQGGANKIGPVLWGVVGRDIATVEDFAYSAELSDKQGVWDYDSLSAFLANPKGWAPGTKMAFAGLKSPEDRANVILYLRSLAESPEPLPEVTAAEPSAPEAEGEPADQETAAVEPSGEPAEGDDAAAAAGGAAGLPARLAQASVEDGQKATRVCAACHTFEEGGANKIGPALWGVVGRDIAADEDFSYSSALSEKEGSWDYEALDHYLTNPRDWAPGTKMAFAGLRKPEDRANVILYLRSLAAEPEPLPEGG